MANKNRYLLVQYIMRPKNKNMTGIKDYMKLTENQSWDELVEFGVGLKKNDMLHYNVILDIDESKILKNNVGKIGNETQWEPVWAYFYNGYQKQIDNFLKRTQTEYEDSKKQLG